MMPMEKYEMHYDDLIAGGVSPIVAKGAILKAGSGVQKRGAVLGRIGGTAEGADELKPVDSKNEDESKKPFAILADVIVDATDADQRISVYLTGEFNRNALTFGGTDTVATHEEALRDIGIFVKTTTV
ncbi:head decoration protein [Paenibacillus larvae]|nr:head decoration protein [Paenibacillus larvae]MCY9710047.1 head decoration protein [Paenibacillus larvae]MCY9718955.1 head decoration protein [Paenibacillus larvae]MDT2292344.1 head decoration protein [Paenibacillus larvae]PCK69930.1 hypothetical protein PL1_2872 [Paenibacillus larvae subsp. larvae B-3650]